MSGLSGKTQRIRLVRPETGGFGFFIRGGAEHGLGIYVSEVEVGSEAHLHGLKAGDQILKVCGMYVDQATHREVTNIIKERANIDLKVRSGGVIPIKDEKSQPVSWKIVKEDSPDVKGLRVQDEDEGVKMEDEPQREEVTAGSTSGEEGAREHAYKEAESRRRREKRSGSVVRRGESEVRRGTSSSRRGTSTSRRGDNEETATRPAGEDETDIVEEKLRISLQGQQGLGCSICKGPPEKPGIFIQSTKVGRLAREVGLRPGDQIISCNRVDFSTIPFGDAVYHLKASKELNLVIRKRAGLDLFPSESSGYDSSASSAGSDSSNKKIPTPPVPPASLPAPPASLPAPPASLHTTQRADSLHITKSLASKTEKEELERERRKLLSEQEQLLSEQEQLETERRKLAAEQELEHERRQLLSQQEKLRREQSALEEERRRLEEEKKIFRSTISKASGSELSASTQSQTSHQSGGSSPAVHPPLRSTLSGVSSLGGQVGSDGETVSGSGWGSPAPESDSGGSTSASSLAAALQSEIRRRAENKTPVGSVTKGILKKPVDNSKKVPFINEKNDKHDLLIAEFKKAHRKMFKGNEAGDEGDGGEESDGGGEGAEEDIIMNNKPKAPPPPPPAKTSTLQTTTLVKSNGIHGKPGSPLYPSISTLGGSMSDSSSTTSLSTFKPDRGKEGPVAPIFIPGIPTPDYDSTPDRSPTSHRRLLNRSRLAGSAAGKMVEPPTVEGISRAKSLTSLLIPDAKESKQGSKGKAPAPGTLKGAASMRDISQTDSPSQSLHSSLRSGDVPSLNFSYSSRSSRLGGEDDRNSQFAKRHLQGMETVSMQSFQIDSLRRVNHKPPATYFESPKPTPLAVTVQPYTDNTQTFNFQTKPCHPSQIPDKPDGEEAQIAGRDYRAAHAQSSGFRIKSTVEVKSFKTGKQKEEKTRGKEGKFAKLTGLKKPAPPPPILRKI